MANTRDIRRRIKSIKNTAQITKAMQLVAASKMKKAQEQTLATRPYANILHEFIVKLSERDPDYSHPLMKKNKAQRHLFIVITTDKGLCGPLNSNLLRKINNELSEKYDFISIGKKGKQFLARLQKNLIADFTVVDPVPFSQIKPIVKFVSEQFLKGIYASINLAYSDFISTLKQEPTFETLLPIQSLDVSEFIKGKRDTVHQPQTSHSNFTGYIYEPSGKAVLNALVPQVVQFRIFQMLLEARASEHSARMVAMKTATDNANDLVKSLTLEYNKIRQAAITSELLDITTAMRALE